MKISREQKVILAVAIVVLLVLPVFLSFSFGLFDKKLKETQKTEEVRIDDQISPYTNQALFLVVNRIRHRGLLDELLQVGAKPWKNKPVYYFQMDIDGEVATSKDIATHANTGEVYFNTWDSIFKDCKMIHDAEEEQAQSTVKISIIEQVKSGLFGRKTSEEVKDEINLVYDYRTGRWNGSDFFRDYDGYGHYVGETFEVWFNLYQDDWDNDGIPYWTEVNVLHTDPTIDDSKLDPDGDGIPTTWEWRWGYDPFLWDDHMHLDPDIDGLENIEEYQMEKWFANPFHQDIYIEVDNMVGVGRSDRISPHIFYDESGQVIIERFCQHNINVYFDTGWADGPINGGGEWLPHVEIMSDTTGNLLQFYNNHFAKERRGIFRYCIMGHMAGFTFPSEFNNYDTIVMGTYLKVMHNQKQAYTARTFRIVIATGVMHELGHTLGLTGTYYAGVDMALIRGKPLKNLAANKEIKKEWNSYKSVMNYLYIYDKHLLDYSDGKNGPPNDQNDWLHLYLPTFETSDLALESATFDTPAVDELGAIGRLEYRMHGWRYNENLTTKYITEKYKGSPVNPIPCDIRVYQKLVENSTQGIWNFRVYAQPQVQPIDSEYVLIDEGYIDSEGTMN
jgi:hypothetical protein